MDTNYEHTMASSSSTPIAVYGPWLDLILPVVERLAPEYDGKYHVRTDIVCIPSISSLNLPASLH